MSSPGQCGGERATARASALQERESRYPIRDRAQGGLGDRDRPAAPAPPGSHVPASPPARQVRYLRGRCQARSRAPVIPEPRERSKGWRGWGAHRHTPQRGSNFDIKNRKHRESSLGSLMRVKGRWGQGWGWGVDRWRQVPTRLQSSRPGWGVPLLRPRSP